MSLPLRSVVFDCILFNGEIDALLIRMHELSQVVDVFVIVEGRVTFSGQPREIAFDPGHPAILPFADRCRHVIVADFPETENPWDRERWQRNAVLRGIPDARPDDLVIMADVDEVPRADVVTQMSLDDKNSCFGLEMAFFYFFVDYCNSAGSQSAIVWAVAARRRVLNTISPDALRYSVRDRKIDACIISDAGWHFSYLMDVSQIRKKVAAFSHQEFNNAPFLDSIDISKLISRGRDLFDRPGFVWTRYEIGGLPSWLQLQRKVLRHLFLPDGWIDRLMRRLRPRITGTPTRRAAPRPPVVICPYVYDYELADLRKKFRLDSSMKPKIDFYFWQDIMRIGPERAFQRCWDQFPDRDIIIIHSDMSPWPEDASDAWYTDLCRYRDVLPQAGMIAANLFYPPEADGKLRVQCAGGTLREGLVNHLHGDVSGEATDTGITAKLLDRVRPVDWVTFGGVLIRREVIQACGGFDSRYAWAFYMDVDYCLEARLRGFRLYQVPARILHEENRTTGQMWTENPELKGHMSVNSAMLLEKWNKFLPALPPEIV